MNPATIRSMMHWMPINVLQNLIHLMFTSKPAFNYFAAGRQMAFQDKRVPLSLKMFILKPIKLLALSDHQDPSGATLLLNPHLQAHL
jgi:hypothetical protein